MSNSIWPESLVPQSHARLLNSTIDVTLTTVSAQGYPESTLVWCSINDKHVLLNIGIGYKKERNKVLTSRFFHFDLADKLFLIEVKGDAELITKGT
jgi:hypothetical protein